MGEHVKGLFSMKGGASCNFIIDIGRQYAKITASHFYFTIT